MEWRKEEKRTTRVGTLAAVCRDTLTKTAALALSRSLSSLN